MSDNDLPTTQKIESLPARKQRSKSPEEVFASLIVYLISGMIVTAIIILVFLFA
jgi:hypothetical protein